MVSSILLFATLRPSALLANAQLSAIQYGGIPSVTQASLTLHQVTFTIKDDQAQIRSESRIEVPAKTTVTVNIPIYHQGDVKGTNQDFIPEALIDDSTLPLRLPLTPVPGAGPTLVTGNIQLAAGVHTLKVRYQSVAARTGLGHTQRTFAYAMGTGPAIARLEFVYHYDQDTVFNVPDLEPSDWKWQSGKTGTYLRKDNFTPNNEVVFLTYYSAKIQNED